MVNGFAAYHEFMSTVVDAAVGIGVPCTRVTGEDARMANVVSAAEVLPFGFGTIAVDRAPVNGFRCAHTHEFVEMSLVRRGTAIHDTESGSVRIAAGDLIIVGQGSWHSYDADGSLELTNLYLSADLIAGELAWMLDFPHLGPIFRNTMAEPTAPAMTLRLAPRDRAAAIAAFNALEHIDGLNHLQRFARVLDLLGALAPAFIDDDSLAEHTADPTAHAHSATGSDRAGKYRTSVSHAVSILHDRIDESWTLRGLGAEVMLSPSQLTRVFTSDTGVAPMAYLQRIRSERMAYLLRTTSLTVASSGRAVGWIDPSHATRRFRAYWSVSPQEYRARTR